METVTSQGAGEITAECWHRKGAHDEEPTCPLRRKGLVGTMANKETHRITVEREPGYWTIRVPDISEVVTQARRLSEVKRNAQEAIAVWLDKGVDEVEVAMDLVVPSAVQSALNEAKQLQQEASEKLERAGQATSEAARWLTKELGMTLREAAEILGVSFQRVGQLLEREAKHNGTRRLARREPKVDQ